MAHIDRRAHDGDLLRSPRDDRLRVAELPTGGGVLDAPVRDALTAEGLVIILVSEIEMTSAMKIREHP